ncbi:response regulator [Oligoflexus tunisiensis]|uniref:response regulator n=1 Tax=Oligoflexus tunisiensis TaxID=708132 RepID=UPI00114D2A15|nr:response regulator [Oligoflexus tunisiensis]
MKKISKFKDESGFADVNVNPGSMDDEQPGSIKGLRILVVDDDGDAALFLARMLINAGAHVRWTTSVPEAFELMDSFHPNLILSDLAMPQQDGFDLIRKFRAAHSVDKGGFVPAIAVSAYSNAEAMQRSFEEGYQAFFPKPVQKEYLIEAVGKLALIQKGLMGSAVWPSMPLSGAF